MKKLEIKVRPAELRDQVVIELFNRNLAGETESKTLDPDVVREGVGAVLRDRAKGIYYVAEVDGEVVGQLMVTYEWSDWRNGMFWWVQSVYVASEFRGKGVFKALMRFLSSQAEEDPGCCGLRLYVHHENHIALETYRKLGFYKLEYEVFEWGGKYPRG